MGARRLFRYIVTRMYWARRMHAMSQRSVLYRPLMVAHPRYISIGAHTGIRGEARIEVILRADRREVPSLTIGSHVNIEQGVHIVCQCRVVIEDDVSITPYCVIVDTEHPFNDPDRLPKIGARLNARTDSFVRIGRGTFIGAHCITLPNVDIGCGCVIGPGSVVTHGMPDYSLAVGAPARVVRRFNTITRAWEPVAA